MSRAVALLVATVAGLTLAVATGTAPPVVAADVDMALIAQPFTVAADRGWSATFAVSGDLGAAIPSATAAPGATPATVPSASVVGGPVVEARVSAHRAVADPLALTTVLDGASTPIVSRATVPVTFTTDGDQTQFSLNVSTISNPGDVDLADSSVLLLARPGVYPVTVELMVEGAVVASSATFLDRLPVTPATNRPTTQVAVVADVTDPGPSPTPAEAAAGRADVRALAESADALGGTITVRVPPVVADDIETSDPALLATMRQAFARAEVLAAPSPSLDPSAAAAAGLQDQFSRALRAGEDQVGTALPSSPPQRSGWLVDDPISAPAASMLRDPLGFDLLVFDADVYNSLEGGIGGYHDWSQAFTVDLGDGTTLPGALVSPSSHWLDRADLDRRQLTPTDGAVRLMAELTVRQALDPTLPHSVVLELPAGVAPDPEVAGALASYLAETPDFGLVHLSSVPAGTTVMEVPGRGPATVRLPATAGPDLGQRVQRVNVMRLTTTGAASMLDDPSLLDSWTGALDELLSTGVSDADADAELERIAGEVRDLYAAVDAPNPFTFTLTGRSSTLRLNIRNNASRDLRVIVRPSSPKLRFPEGDTSVVLGADRATEVLIPVEAQSNGTSALGIEIVTPTGNQTVQGPVIMTARVNALSGLGQVVTGGAILILVSWWYGHFRRRRRQRRAMLGEVDNPPVVATAALSPDAAEAVARNGDGAPAPAAPTPTPDEPTAEPSLPTATPVVPARTDSVPDP
jgi:hypothetical protein